MSEQPPEYGTTPSPDLPSQDPSSAGEAPTSPAADAAPKAALWEDFLDIFYSPTSVFRRREGKPWWPAFLIVVVLGVVLFYLYQQVLSPVMQVEAQRQAARIMERNPNVTEEDLARMGGMGNSIFSLIMVAVVYPISILLTGVVLWLFGKLFGAAATVGSVIMVATYAQVVRLAQTLVGILQGLVMDVNAMDSMHDVALSLARFMDPDTTSGLMIALGSRVDVFLLWSTVLLAIGLHVVGRISKASAYTAAFLVWALAALPQVLGALVSG